MAKGKRKRITRRQLKEDKFVSYTFRVSNVLRRHSRPIITGGIILVAAAVIATGYVRWSQSKTAEIDVVLGEALSLYAGGDPGSAGAKFTELIQSYPGRRAKSAYLYLGNIALAEERFGEARTLFQNFLREGPQDEILRPSAYAGIAQSHEEEGSFSLAAEAYEEAFRRFPGRSELARYLLDAARCYELVGDFDSAVDRYREVIAGFPESNLSQTAERQLKLLYPKS